jgi:Transposase IS66 family
MGRDVNLEVQLHARQQIPDAECRWRSLNGELLSRKSETAKTVDYSLKRWTALTHFLDDGRLCMSNNAAERAVRCIAVGPSLLISCPGIGARKISPLKLFDRAARSSIHQSYQPVAFTGLHRTRTN